MPKTSFTAIAVFCAICLACLRNKGDAQRCIEQDRDCEFWASIGECERNAIWMLPNCPISCRQCIPIQSSVNVNVGNPFEARISPVPQSIVSLPDSTDRAPANEDPPSVFERCQELSTNQPSDLAERLMDSNLVVSAETSRLFVTKEQVEREIDSLGCAPSQNQVDCGSNICYNLMFRTIDGTCNNLQDSLKGAAFTPALRLLAIRYDDGVSAPVDALRNARPSPRAITVQIISSPLLVTHTTYNGLIMQWGQYLAHDIVKTPLLKDNRCTTCTDVRESCLNIQVGLFDNAVNNFECDSPRGNCCMRVGRSAPVCGTGTRVPKSQLNELTAYVDASNVYGSSVPEARRLRAGSRGQLRMERFDGTTWLPRNGSEFLAGDDRASEFTGLAALHTIFAREHNRLAAGLSAVNPHWSDDRLYQEARKIVGAVHQAITYRAWLPKVLGDATQRLIGDYRGYNSRIDPSVAIEFSTAILRFGHGLIQESYPRLDGRGNLLATLELLDGINATRVLFQNGGAASILRGMASLPSKMPQRVTRSISNELFGNRDLPALNINRGRDNGIASYGEVREFCGMPRAQRFDDLASDIVNAAVRQQLAAIYNHPDDIDLFAGAILEEPIRNGLVGPTMACLIGNQFARIRDGDRFWFERPGVFTRAQRAEIERHSLAKVLCDNGEDMINFNRDAFSLGNVQSCDRIPTIRLDAWRTSS